MSGQIRLMIECRVAHLKIATFGKNTSGCLENKQGVMEDLEVTKEERRKVNVIWV